MPLTAPNLDNRRYQDLVDDALARIPIHTPEWTNFNKSDPGVTLIEVFAFLTETLLYRCNQIPDRMRKKFLQLLSVPLRPASAAQGLITATNAKNALASFILQEGLEVRAGKVPFLTSRPLEVLPVEGKFFVKQVIDNPAPELVDYYRQLYASYRTTPAPLNPTLYQSVPFAVRASTPLSLDTTVDGYIWLALTLRDVDKPASAWIDQAREAIAGKTLTLGVVPYLGSSTSTLVPGQQFGAANRSSLRVECPQLPPGGGLLDSEGRVPQYRVLDTAATSDPLAQPGVVDIQLPATPAELMLWQNVDPLEAGVNQLPPDIDDSALKDRVITWLRIRPVEAAQAQFLWMGINAVPMDQRVRVFGEILPEGTGEPDQTAKLSRAPVLANSVKLTVAPVNGQSETWIELEDLFLAGPEVPVPDVRLPPGALQDSPGPSKAFALDAEAGELQFGDGLRGARPPASATLLADYEYTEGAEGNLGPDAITTSPAAPSGFKFSNPISTWGGADEETVAEGEKQVARYVQHRDRLVTKADFETISLRTPGIAIGRVDVIPTYHPSIGDAGSAAGAVTLMVIPTYDAGQPDAPRPSRDFLNALCAYLDQRRLVTTEVFLRGPDYVGVWISIGIDVVPGLNDAPVREAVKAALTAFLAPTRGGTQTLPADPAALLTTPQVEITLRGWPRGKAVLALELAAVASRVPGVLLVRQPVRLAAEDGAEVSSAAMINLNLPRILGLSVVAGDPISINDLRGTPGAGGTPGTTDPSLTPTVVQVPAIPEECR